MRTPRTSIRSGFLAGGLCAAAWLLAPPAMISSASGQIAIAEAAELAEPPPATPGHPREARGGPHRSHEHSDREAQQQRREDDPTEPDAGPRDWFGPGGRPWLEWDHALGDLGGLRTSLESSGLSVHVSYILDWSTVFSGGASQRGATNTLFDVAVEFDLAAMAGVPGASVFLNYYSTDGRGQGRAGDFQGWSNIETDENEDQIGELWYQQRLFGDRLRLKFGKIDSNTEFAFVESAGEFLNSSTGFSPTIAFMPTYPDPATGLVGFVEPSPWLYIGAGLFDGAAGDGFRTGPSGPASFFSDDRSSDWFVIAEAGVKWDALPFASPGGGVLQRGRAAVGGWMQTGTLERFDGGAESGTRGMYLLAEQQVWASSPATTGALGGATAEDADRGLWLFFQFGVADDEVVEAGMHLAAGLVLNGTFPGRERDSAGVYYSWVDLSDDPDAGFDRDESVLELYYKLQFTPWVSVKPDLQLIWNPGGDSQLDTAVVGAIRFEIVF